MGTISQYLTLLRYGAIAAIVDIPLAVAIIIMLWHVLDRLPPRTDSPEDAARREEHDRARRQGGRW